MRCCAAQKRLTPLLLGELEHSDADQVLAHARVCKQCRREMDALGLTMDLMRELPQMPFPSEIDARLAERVGAEERKARGGLLRSWQARTVAAVATVALLAGLVAVGARALRIRSLSSTVVFVQGEPRIEHNGKIRTATEGMRIAPGHVLITDETARALIQLPDGSLATVDYDSRVELHPEHIVDADTQQADLEVHSGRASLWSPGDGEGTRVRFADCTAFVQAAEAMVAVGPGGGPTGARLVALGSDSLLERRGSQDIVTQGQEARPGTEQGWQYSSAEARLDVLRVQSRLGRHYTVWRAPALRRDELLLRLATPRVHLGIDVAPGPAAEGGLTVVGGTTGSPAEVAGILVGDLLVSVDGNAVGTAADLAAAEILLQGRDDTTVAVKRRGQARRMSMRTSTIPLSFGCSPRSSRDIARAGELLARERSAEAEQLYRTISIDDPTCVPSRLNLALLMEHQYDWRGAARLCAEAVALAPTVAEIRLAYGHALLGIGNVRRASEELMLATELHPQLAQARYLLGLSLLFGEREEDSRVEAQRLRRECARADLAEILLGDMELFRARAHDSQTDQGRAAARAQFETAKAHFELAREAAPGNLTAILRLARTHLALADIPAAEEACKEALRQDAHCPEAANTLGLVFIKRAKVTEGWLSALGKNSEATFSKKRRKDFIAAGLQELIGASRGQLIAGADENWRRAEGWFGYALRIRPTSVEAITNLGSVAINREDFQEAQRLYARAVALDPTLAPVRRGLGIALQERHRYAEAETQYELALRLDPTDKQTCDRLVQLRESQHRFADAEQTRLRYML